jgi:ribosomal protein S18 acetylase RimI-like enzyme
VLINPGIIREMMIEEAPMITFRRATAEDAVQLARVHIDSWRTAYQGQVPQDLLESLDVNRRADRFRESLAAGAEESYIIEREQEILGILTIGACRDDDGDPEHTAEVWGIYLAPQHWGKGLGRYLLEEGERILWSRGYNEATLWVLASNEQAKGFYEAMGFRPDGGSKEIHLRVPLRAVRYRKRLEGGREEQDDA